MLIPRSAGRIRISSRLYGEKVVVFHDVSAVYFKVRPQGPPHMDEQPHHSEFQSSEDLLEFLREHSDDIDSVVIPVQHSVEFHGPAGQRLNTTKVGAVLKLCSGRLQLISREDAAMLINDGVLQRMKIKCVLDPLDGSGDAT